jgi:hypothetical protein
MFPFSDNLKFGKGTQNMIKLADFVDKGGIFCIKKAKVPGEQVI